MKNYLTTNTNLFKKIVVVFTSVMLVVAMLNIVNIYIGNVQESRADDETLPIYDGTSLTNFTVDNDNKSAGSKNAELTLGRAIDLTKYGTSFRPEQVVKSQVSKVLDVQHNPCLAYVKDPAARQFATLKIADSKKEFGKKYSYGVEASFNSANSAKPGRSLDSMIWDPRTGTTGNQTGPVDGTKYELLPDSTLSKMSGSPAAAGGAASFGRDGDNAWTTRERHFDASLSNAVFTSSITHNNNTIPTSDGKCASVEGISENAQLWANTTQAFKDDVLSKGDPRQFLERWGDLVVTNASFGSKASIKYKYTSSHSSKSDAINTSVKANFGALTGGGNYNSTNRSVFDDSRSDINVEGYGGYSPPSFDFDDDFKSKTNRDAMENWYKNATTAGPDILAFIGSAVTNSGDIKDTKYDSSAINDIGKFIWEYVDDKILAPEGVNYPDAASCNGRFTSQEDRNLLDDCLLLAGKRMTYQDYLHITYRTMLLERGNIKDELPPPPYVKDIYFGYSDGNCYHNKTCFKEAKADLDKNMSEACKTAMCIKFNTREDNAQSMNSNEYSNGAWTKRVESILFGYTLTTNPEEALVNVDLWEGKLTDLSNAEIHCPYNVAVYPAHYPNTTNSVCLDNTWYTDDDHYLDMWRTFAAKHQGEDSLLDDVYNSWVDSDTIHPSKHNGVHNGNMESNVDTTKMISLSKLQRYNPNMPSTNDNGVYVNTPITAIGLQNMGSHKSCNAEKWPTTWDIASQSAEGGCDDNSIPPIENANHLSTGALRDNWSNDTIWKKLGLNLNNNTGHQGEELYFWIGH